MSDASQECRWHLRHSILFASISLVYLTAAFAVASRKAPWNDEGWFADPAYTLLTKGYMGSPIVHPRGTWLPGELTGIHTYTYWQVPGYSLLQVAWYWLFGFGLMQMRAISMIAGLVTIWAWAYLVWYITQNRRAAWLTAALLAIDVTFLYSAGDGRPDMTTVALGSLGLVAFVCLRERSLSRALLVANACVGAAMYCHPNGMVFLFLLAVFVAYFDRQRLRWGHLLSLAPYAVFAGAWLIYILQRPDYFLAQFRANSASHMVDRAAGLRNPFIGIYSEVMARYFRHFGGVSFWARLPGLTRIIPICYWGCLACLLYSANRTKNLPARFICFCAVGLFLFMSIFVAVKAAYYLGAVMPLYASCAALAVCLLPGKINLIPFLMLTVLLLTNGLGLMVALYDNEYALGYAPAMAYLKSHATPETPINGSPAILFALPEYRVTDDSRLHDLTPYIVVDQWYRYDWKFIYGIDEKQTAADVERKLQLYTPVFDHDGWTVLQRR